MIWVETDKGDPRARALADRHYSRQSVGAALFTRPGRNITLLTVCGRGLFVWWTGWRHDGLPSHTTAECTIFRNEGAGLSSELIDLAVRVLLYQRPDVDDIITAVASSRTASRRGRASSPGACFRAAGWVQIEGKASARADTWLRLPRQSWPSPRPCALETRGQMRLLPA